jgi:hypothetical protein
MGSEFMKDLDSFLAKFNISLNASKPYSKGSSSNSESAIRLVKAALRQLCLTHTHNWPEMIPLLVQGINATGLYGTATTRSMLYFSPYSYTNELKLDGLLFPETIFNEHFHQLKHIVKRRQNNLSKNKILDKTKYQIGNLVLAVNHPVQNAETKGKSQELAMTVKGIYYIKDVHPAHLRLIGLFTGEERTLPREYCVKISLDNLSTLQVQLQSLQLQKVSSSLFRANKFLPPNQAKTWNFLLDKNNHHERDESCDLPDLENLDPDRSEILPDNVINYQDDDQVSGPLPDRQLSPLFQSEPTTHDTLSQPQKNQLMESDPHVRQKKILRYGRAYFSLLTQPEPRSILRNSCSLQQTTPPSQSPIESEAQPIVKPPGHDSQFPGHGVNRVKSKSIKWSDNLNIRFIQGEDIREYDQKLLVHTESSCVLPPTSYLMLSAIGIDTSSKELMYKSTWSSPNLSNDVILFL